MTQIQTGIIQGQLFLEVQAGNPTMNWLGNDYVVVTGTARKGFIESFGQKETVNNVSITVRLFDADGNATFTGNQPIETQRVIFGGETYEIYLVERPYHGATITLKCQSPFKGSAIRS